MKRDCLAKLKLWKASQHRKPLILRGARQTGKTHLLREFGAQEYVRCHYFHFEQDPRLASIFHDDLRPNAFSAIWRSTAGKPSMPAKTS